MSMTAPVPEADIRRSPPENTELVETSSGRRDWVQGEANVQGQGLSHRLGRSVAIKYNPNTSSNKRSPIGPRRLNFSSSLRRQNNGLFDRHGHAKQHQYSGTNPWSRNYSAYTDEYSTSPMATLSGPGILLTKGPGNRRIRFGSVSNVDDAQGLTARGLLDPIVPIVGLIPGLEGVIELVPELLNGLLGPALGGLVISPSKPQSHALATTNSALSNDSQYVLAATKGNASTIWLVDTGCPAPPDSESTLSSNSSAPATTNERLVSLQMAFVDAKSGKFKPYCATYERDPTKPVSLGVIPCKDSNPIESQMFAYDPETSILRAVWGSYSVGEKTLGMRMRRQYMVGVMNNTTIEGGQSMVVMVFRAANVSSPVDNPSALEEISTQSLPHAAGSTMDHEEAPGEHTSEDRVSAQYDIGSPDDGLEDYQGAETTSTESSITMDSSRNSNSTTEAKSAPGSALS